MNKTRKEKPGYIGNRKVIVKYVEKEINWESLANGIANGYMKQRKKEDVIKKENDGNES